MKDNITKTPTVNTKDLIAEAHAEVEEENRRKAIILLKDKIREMKKAELVVDNLREEIKILEEKIKRGDLE